jgi:predicted Zn-dependent peptidase
MSYRPRLTVWLALVVSTLAVTTAQAGYKLVAAPAENDPSQVSIYQLDNGLTVYLTENHETPTFYSEIVVRAGHKQDPATNTGLAHYLEHLLFKGNANFGTTDYEKEAPHIQKIYDLYEERFNETDPAKRDAIYEQINKENIAASAYAIPNEMSNVYESLGGFGLNAHTWFEETVYKIGLPANQLRQWATIESDRFIDPVFRLFVTELEIVYEEKNRALDSKDRIVFEALAKELFKKHPYGQQTTLGEVEHLKNPSLKAVKDYYDTYYVPNNMAVIISGAIDTESTIKLVDEFFSVWQAKPLPEPKVYEEEPMTRREQVTVEYDAEPYMLMGYRLPGRNHPDADALILVDMVLANSTAGLIDLNLVQSQKLRTAGASPYLMNDYGWEMLWATPKDGQTLEEAEQLVLEQLNKVKAGEFDDELLQGIIASLKIDQKRSLESDSGRVAMLRNSFLSGMPWSYTVAQLDRMAKLTKQDVIDAANKYYGGGYVVAYRVEGERDVPPITKPKIDTIEIDPTRRSAFAEKVLNMPTEPIEPTFIVEGRDYTVTDYADGVQLYHAPNPINDLFSLSFVIETGTRHDKDLDMAARLINQAGTKRLSPEELKKAWFALGTDFSVGVGADRTYINLSGLDENLGASLDLLMEVMQTPAVDQQKLTDMVENFITSRQQDKKSHRTIASAVRELARYGEESNYIDVLSDEQLRALKSEELLAKVSSLMGYKHSIRYTGALPVGEVVSVLRSHHPADGELKDPPPYRPRLVRVPDKVEVRFHDKVTAQSMVYVDTPSAIYDESLVPGSSYYNQYFGGMSGLAFQELRESRALAYVVGAFYANADRTGERNQVIGMIGCQVDKTVEALDGLLGLFDGMPISQERFDQGKTALINSYRTGKIGFRGVIGAVDGWNRLGITEDPRPQRMQAVSDADITTLTDFYQNQVKGRPKYITVVGEKAKIDMDKLKEEGEFTEVSLEDIFAY